MRDGLAAAVTAVRERMGEASRSSLFLLFGGAFLAAVGIAAAVWSAYARGLAIFGFREVAGIALGLALPMFLGGILLGHPAKAWERWTTAAAGAVVLVGVALFSLVYPYFWNVSARTDWSPRVIAIYATGLSVLAILVFRVVLFRFLGRVDAASEEAPVSEEEVRRDLESAQTARLSWGGIATREAAPLSVDLPPGAAQALSLTDALGVQITLPGEAAETAARATTRLRAMQGSFVTWQESDSTSSETNALAVLRAAERAKRESSFWFRLKTGRLFHLDRILAPAGVSDGDEPSSGKLPQAIFALDPYGATADLAAAAELDEAFALAPAAVLTRPAQQQGLDRKER